MNYDNWKTQPPEYYDYEEGKGCGYCGEPIKDTKDFCNSECRKANEND